MDWKAFFRSIGIAILKSFRGLICETKNGEWELSKGSVAFWVVFIHSMFVWNKVGDIIGVNGDTMEAIIKHADISDGELYTLWALLGYAGIKVGATALENVTAIIKAPKTTEDAG